MTKEEAIRKVEGCLTDCYALDDGEGEELIEALKQILKEPILDNIKIKLGLYNIRKEGAKWVAKNMGEKYVEEFLAKYDDINRGVPIGGIAETIVFLNMIEEIKKQI